MLHRTAPGQVLQEAVRFMPQVLAPLVSAAESDQPLQPVVASITRIFGFDSFMYGTSQIPRPGHEELTYVFTTLPTEWVLRYDQRAYIEIDHRVLHSYDNAMPLVWDQGSERGKSRACDEFLEDAAAHGIASGVAFAVHAASRGQVLVSFNSTRPAIDDLRRFEIARNLGDMVLLGIYFHEVFMKSVVLRGRPTRLKGVPLSPREVSCLAYSAHGYTGRQIATVLDISERTVEVYFASSRSKLGTPNRHAAIAKAIDEGIIKRGHLPDPRGVDALVTPVRPLSSPHNFAPREA
jgi:DNA-binding CsgD family transcriptional regulator